MNLKGIIALSGLVLFLGGCSSLPDVDNTVYEYPKGEAFTQAPKRAYSVVGTVRSRVNFQTLTPDLDLQRLCRNYFNKAVKELVKFAKEKGADAVIDVKSVVFLMDGSVETHPRPECAEDGAEGQVLTQGTAVKWKKKT